MIKFSIDNETLICNFPDRMDTDNCLQSAEGLYAKVKEENKPVVFDLQKVDYVSSMFLSMCLNVSKEAGSGNFSLINVHPSVKKVFKIAGLDRLMMIQ